MKTLTTKHPSREPSPPPTEPVLWSCMRRDGAELFTTQYSNGQSCMVKVHEVRRVGRTARGVWQEHLAKYGAFSDFLFRILDPAEAAQ